MTAPCRLPDAPILPPRPAALPADASPLAGLRRALANPLSTVPDAAFRDATMSFRVLNRRVHYVLAPDLIEQVLRNRTGHYGKSRLQERLLGPLIGKGLLASEGEEWRKRRLLLAPLFRPAAVAERTAEITDVFHDLLDGWGREAAVRDADKVFRPAVFRLIAHLAGGEAMATRSADLYEALETYLEIMGKPDLGDALMLPPWVPKRGMLRARRAVRRLRALIRDVVKTPHAADGSVLSFLRGEEPASVIDEMATLLFAGHEATASAIAWTLYLLSLDQAAQARVRAELNSYDPAAFPSGAQALTTWTGRAIAESLRLYPPSLVMARDSRLDHTLGDAHIAKGDTLLVSPWVTHRHCAVWQEPDRFRPTRFWRNPLHPEEIGHHRFAHIPFGGGPHVCLGAALADLIIRIALRSVLSRYEVEPVSNAVISPVARITLRADGGLPLCFRARPRSV